MDKIQFLFLVALILGLVWQVYSLGKHLDLVSSAIRREMATLVGNHDRARELVEERRLELEAQRKVGRSILITLGVIGAAALAWSWFTH